MARFLLQKSPENRRFRHAARQNGLFYGIFGPLWGRRKPPVPWPRGRRRLPRGAADVSPASARPTIRPPPPPWATLAAMENRETAPGGPLPTYDLAEQTRDEAANALLIVQGGSMRPPARVPRTDLDDDAKALVALATARTGRPLAAAEALGYSPAAVRAAVEVDPAFAASLEAARGRRVEDMEAAVDRRAFDGIEETTFSKDGAMTKKLVFSDKLAELRLKAEAPDKYTDRRHVQIDARAAVLVVPAVATSTDEWARSVGAG